MIIKNLSFCYISYMYLRISTYYGEENWEIVHVSQYFGDHRLKLRVVVLERPVRGHVFNYVR